MGRKKMSEFVTDIGFDSKSLWQPKGFEPHTFPESTWPLLKDLNLKTLTEIEGEDLTPVQGMVKQPMATGTFRHFHNDKIEKLALMWLPHFQEYRRRQLGGVAYR